MKNQKPNVVAIDINAVKSRMLEVRGQQVLLDRDVAALYGVETRVINQAVKNNPEKFPAGYVVELSSDEFATLRSKFLTANISSKSRALPKVFTEKGLYMLATILKGEQAVRTTLAIIETYAEVRSMKRELLALHTETDVQKRKSMMQHFGEVLTDIVMPDLTTLLPRVVQALTASYEAFRTDVSRFERNVRYAHNEYAFPLAKYAFRRTASVLALSIRRIVPY